LLRPWRRQESFRMLEHASLPFLATNEPAAQKHDIFSEKRSSFLRFPS
jgi:hypothetical protein